MKEGRLEALSDIFVLEQLLVVTVCVVQAACPPPSEKPHPLIGKLGLEQMVIPTKITATLNQFEAFGTDREKASKADSSNRKAGCLHYGPGLDR